jgi:hypothetical protein
MLFADAIGGNAAFPMIGIIKQLANLGVNAGFRSV